LKTLFRWGIIAPGRISGHFAEAVTSRNNADLVAVYGRNLDKAKTFAKRHHIDNVYDDIDAFLGNDDIDAVYIAPPHPSHKPFALKCLNARKAVLCEKPMTINAADTRELVSCAQKNNTFLMEAVWTRFLPTILQVKKWMDTGEIGTPRMMQGTFTFKSPFDPQSRAFNPELAGGGLLDVGIYPIHMGCYLYGEHPIEINSQAYMSTTGVDEQGVAIFTYSGGKMLNAAFGINCDAQHPLMIYGDAGYIEVKHPFYGAEKAILHREDKDPIVFEEKLACNGFEYEAEAVMQCVQANNIECDIINHAESIAVAETLDTIRAQWGLVYPMEK
jgi:dihydrodiol dehydrogenase / D-xylose 1-dehydrogenase (NADP)